MNERYRDKSKREKNPEKNNTNKRESEEKVKAKCAMRIVVARWKLAFFTGFINPLNLSISNDIIHRMQWLKARRYWRGREREKKATLILSQLLYNWIIYLSLYTFRIFVYHNGSGGHNFWKHTLHILWLRAHGIYNIYIK